jgi:hypothetical protein
VTELLSELVQNPVGTPLSAVFDRANKLCWIARK